MENIIIIAALAVIAGLAAFYIIRVKKKGKKCIGCHLSKCPSKEGGCGADCNCCLKDK